ncbi:hypothetical protein PILCRDRAFT_816838 [Piloderma croceum F 1598]|uniref:BZIP domain-containing protein n=1 Tax=Piloderma croceum (strain F 1598) TaxID=765440 RepID=A0A0C3G1F4_PILCF|nr:hypothetical protein PILCRDRAFT_816838 [Piloderma croceum F 1598]
MGDPSEFLNMYLDDDYSKPMMPPPSSGAPYDFLGAFSSITGSSSSATSSPSAATSPSHSSPHEAFSSTAGESPQMGIDPSLVGIGSPVDGFDDEHDDHDEEDDTVSEIIAPIKVGGKGKGRKGTVASGGIKKLTPASSTSSGKENVNKDAGSGGTTVEDRESDDWRPSPEEYKKMSSKEKRQLRNKISARNFRVRRKEYISTLEADISERDSLISAIRSELGSSQSENIALRQEIAALKRSLLAGRGMEGEETGLVLPPPAPLSPVSLTSSFSSPSAGTSVRAPSPLITPNTQKDLPTSPRLGAAAARHGFWGGAATGGGGYTPVHTTFVPPLSMVGVGVGISSAVLARKGVHQGQGQQQENINPSLNALPLPARVPSPPITNPSPFTTSTTKITNSSLGAGGVGGFDAFTDMNPFTLKTLDAYRMQLWGKMAAQGQVYQQQQAQQHQQQQQQHQLSGLASGLRPQFFRDAHGLSGSLLSGKSSVLSSSSSSSPASSYPTPPNSPPALHKSFAAGFAGRAADKEKEKEVQRDAMYAALASQTLLGKLGSAFWDAFSGGSTSSASSFGSNTAAAGANRQWDADKVRKVLEGKAVVRVVDVVESNPTTKTSTAAKLPVAGSSSSLAKLPRAGDKSEKEKCIMTDILEESMRSLSLGKK